MAGKPDQCVYLSAFQNNNLLIADVVVESERAVQQAHVINHTPAPNQFLFFDDYWPVHLFRGRLFRFYLRFGTKIRERQGLME
jgi:hypothetical protein